MPKLVIAQSGNDSCAMAQRICNSLNPVGGSTANATANVCPGCSDGATVAGNFCFELDNTVWYYFKTNQFGGNAFVKISNINCTQQNDFGTGLQAVVLKAGSDCDESTYTAVSNCETGSSADIDLTANMLDPNSVYYVLIDGDRSGGANNGAHCAFDVEVWGNAVELRANLLVEDDSCLTGNGKITVDTVYGANPPYEYSLGGSSGYQTDKTFDNLVSGEYAVFVKDVGNCLSYASVAEVGQRGGVRGTQVTVTTQLCNGSDGSISVNGVDGGIAPFQYALDTNALQTGTQFNGVNAGEHLITIEGQNGCKYDTTVIVPTSSSISSYHLLTTRAECGDSNGVINFLGAAGSKSTFSLNGVANTPPDLAGFSGLKPGKYTIVITDTNGCTYTMYEEVIEGPGSIIPYVDIVPSLSPSCAGVPVTFNSIYVDEGEIPNFEWIVNGTSVMSGSTDSLVISSPNEGDIVVCQLTSSSNCLLTNPVRHVDTIKFKALTPVGLTVSPGRDSACAGDSVMFIAIDTGCDGTGIYTWFIDNVQVQTGASDTLYTTELSSNSVVTATFDCDVPCSDQGVSNDTNIWIENPLVDAGEDISIAEGTSVQIGASGDGTPAWEPLFGLSDTAIYDPVANPSLTTTYALTVTTPSGCKGTDKITVIVLPDINIKNTFTPNGDGFNDLWVIPGIDQHALVKVMVFSRWGQRVFNQVGYDESNAWDGTFLGSVVPAGVYYYSIELRGEDNGIKRVNGHLTIIY